MSKYSAHQRSRQKFSFGNYNPNFLHQNKLSSNYDYSELNPARQPLQNHFQKQQFFHQNQAEQGQRKDKINTLHRNYEKLKEQMKNSSENNRPSIHRSSIQKLKQISQQRYVEDKLRQAQRSSSQSQKEVRYKHKRLTNHLYSMPKSTLYLDQYFLNEKKSKSNESEEVAGSNDSRNLKQNEPSSFLKDHLNKQISRQYSPPLPRYKKHSVQQSISDQSSPVRHKEDKIENQQNDNYSAQSRNKLISERPLIIKNCLQNFSSQLIRNMGNIVKKFDELQKKHLSLDLYFQELKQIVNTKKKDESQQQQIRIAKQRQNKFIINQAQTKMKQMKAHNERLEKELKDSKAIAQQKNLRIQQYESKIKSLQKLEQANQKLKKLKVQAEKKYIQVDLQLKKTEKEKNNCEEQLQKMSKMNSSSLKPHKDIDASASSQLKSSNSRQNNAIVHLNEQIQFLQQKIEGLQSQNKSYEKLLVSKGLENETFIRSLSENKMHLQKIKEINTQLQKQCRQLQKQKMQNEIQSTQKICTLNSNVKKKLQEYDSFKDSIIHSLGQLHKKMPKRNRKIIQHQLLNKNRTNKCELYFKNVGEFISQSEQRHNKVVNFIQSQLQVTNADIQNGGYQQFFNQITAQFKNKAKTNERLKSQVQNLKKDIARLIDQRKSQQQDKNRKQEVFHPSPKKIGSKGMTKDSKELQINSGKISYNNQQLLKRRLELQQLHKEIENLTQQSHKKYLDYQKRISELEIKDKQNLSKIQNLTAELQESISRTTRQEESTKKLQKIINDFKTQSESHQDKINQFNSSNKKGALESLAKAKKLQVQNDSFKKNIKKIQNQLQLTKKTLSTKLNIKEKYIDDLLEQKKKMIVEIKILNQRLEFSKIMNQTKNFVVKVEKPQQQEQSSIVNIMDNSLASRQFQELQNQINQSQQKVKELVSRQNLLNERLSEAQKEIQSKSLEMKRKEALIQKNAQQYRENAQRSFKIQQQYKKIIQQYKRDKEQNDRRYEVDKQKRSKEIAKLTRQLQSKQSQIFHLATLKSQQSGKLKDIDQRFSQSKREKQQLLKMIEKKEDQLNSKQQALKNQQDQNSKLQTKYDDLTKQLFQRLQYFKKTQQLMQKIFKQNQAQKNEIQNKQNEIFKLIKERQQLNFKLSQDLDAKSQNMKFTKFKYQNEIAILKQQIQALEIALESSKQELKIKNQFLQERKNKSQNQKNEANSVLLLKQEHQKRVNQLNDDILRLNSKIDILQEQDLQMKGRIQQWQSQLEAVKIQKVKYYKLLTEKYEYIQELQQIVKIKLAESQTLKEELQNKFKEQRQYHQEIENKLKEQIQTASNQYKRLEESIINLNNLNQTNQKNQQEKQNVILQMGQTNKELKIINSGLNAQLANSRKTLSDQIQANTNLKQQLQTLSAAIKSLQLQIYHKNHQLYELKATIQEITQQKSAALQQKESLISQLDKKERQIMNLIQNSEQLKVKLSQDLGAKSQYAESIIRQKLKRQDSLKEQVQTLKSKIQDLQKQMRLKNQQINELRATNRPNKANFATQQYQEKMKGLLKQLDQTKYQYHKLKQQHKLSQNYVRSEHQQKIQSLKLNTSILEKQLLALRETVVLLSRNCEKQQGQIEQLKVNLRKAQLNQIVAQSSNHLDFNSVELEPQERRSMIKINISQSEQNNKLALASKLIEKVVTYQKQLSKNSHHFDQPFDIGEVSQFQWPSLQAKNNDCGVIKSEYLQKFKKKLQQIIFSKEGTFSPSFQNYHSNSALQILKNLKYNLADNGKANESVLQQLAFIDQVQTDFCQNLEEQLQQFIQVICSEEVFYGTEQPNKQKSKYQGRLDQILKINQQKQQLVKRSQMLEKQVEEKENQIEQYQTEMRKMIQEHEEEEEQCQRNFMKQSQVLKKEISNFAAKANKYCSNFGSLLKINAKLLQIWFSKQEMREDLSDCFQHLSKISSENDQKISNRLQQYFTIYAEQRLILKGKQAKKKKTWF